MLKFQGQVQNYAWGKLGSDSTVAQLAGEQSIVIDENLKYAEYWYGTHPNGMGTIPSLKDQTLIDYLSNNPAALKGTKHSVSSPGLPFLLKVLSVGKALSIQAHPNKTLGAQLLEAQPSVYKDPNHKPEMACAVTQFEALAGFEDLGVILRHVEATPELAGLLLLQGVDVKVLRSYILNGW